MQLLTSALLPVISVQVHEVHDLTRGAPLWQELPVELPAKSDDAPPESKASLACPNHRSMAAAPALLQESWLLWMDGPSGSGH
jgi:hypothetical protein